MADFLKSFRVRSASPSKTNKFDFVEDHTSTCDFMDVLPLYKRLLVPRSSFRTSVESFCRLNPLTSVNYGRASFNCRAFFVPLRTAWYGWNEFVNDAFAKGSVSSLSTVPYIDNTILTSFLRNNKVSTRVSITSNPGDISPSLYDFAVGVSVTETAGTWWLYKLTPYGKKCYRIMRSLGYDFFPPTIELGSGSSNPPRVVIVDYRFNALPLLCLARIVYDWYYPSQYVSQLADVQRAFYQTTSYGMSQTTLTAIFDILNVAYPSDYFTSAFDRPNSPSLLSSESPVSFEAGDGYSDSGQMVGSDAQLVTNVDNNLVGSQIVDPHLSTVVSNGRAKISQFALDSLYALSSYLKRNQLAGSRVIDRYLARFGVKLSSSQIERCLYLGGESHPLKFGTVFSQSDTVPQSGNGGSIVGDYNGVGSFEQPNPWSFSCESGEDFGYFFVLGSFMPSIGYVQGIDRDIMYSSRFDFPTPEFDSLGTQAISAAELVSGNVSGSWRFRNWNGILQKVFGHVPRYAEGKTGKDRVSGDFALPSQRNTELNSYTLKRMFEPDSFLIDNVPDVKGIVHSVDFVTNKDSGQYNRIFYTNTGVEDHLRLVALFRSEMYAPLAQLYDVYDWDKHNETGNEVTLDSNGPKLT